VVQRSATPNFTYGVTFIFAVVLLAAAALAAFLLVLGIGLLKGRKWAWYTQIVLSVLHLMNFPIGTIFSVLILILFFQEKTRERFGV
jgi:hypothetical protein